MNILKLRAEVERASYGLTKLRRLIVTDKFKRTWERATDEEYELIKRNLAEGNYALIVRWYTDKCNRDLESMTRDGLRSLASKYNIPFYSRYNTTELRRLIRHVQHTRKSETKPTESGGSPASVGGEHSETPASPSGDEIEGGSSDCESRSEVQKPTAG